MTASSTTGRGNGSVDNIFQKYEFESEDFVLLGNTQQSDTPIGNLKKIDEGFYVVVGDSVTNYPVSSVFSRTGSVVAEDNDYNASQIEYDNTTSGLVGDTVQLALDEVISVEKYNTLLFGSNQISTTTTVRYLHPNYSNRNSITNSLEMIMPFSGTMDNFYLRHNLTGPDSTLLTYTVLLNGNATPLSITIANNVVSSSNTINSFSFNKGDRVSIRINKAATLTGAARYVMASLRFSN